MKFGVFYGSTTGNTENAAQLIKDQLAEFVPDEIIEIRDAKAEQLLQYDLVFLGVSTWHIGDMQDDWADFLPKLKKVDLTGQKVALFAMGDAVGYPDNFLDAMGELWEACKARGAQLVGVWPTEGYTFDESRAMYDEHHFVGLGLDEDNESELTEERVNTWLIQVVQELQSEAQGATEAA